MNYILQGGSQRENGKSDIIFPYITEENQENIFFWYLMN